MFRIELINQAIGQAYNALLNHIHLYPIFSYNNYKNKNVTTWKGEAGDPLWLGIYRTLRQAIIDATLAKRQPTVLLANPADRFDIELHCVEVLP